MVKQQQKRGQHGYGDANSSSTCINMEQRLLQQAEATTVHQGLLHSTYLRLLVQLNTITSDCISFIGFSFVISGYQGNTYPQLLVQQHLRHLQQRQLRLLRQQHSLEGCIIRRHQVGLPNAHYINLRDISTRTRTSFYVSAIESTPAILSTDVRGD